MDRNHSSPAWLIGAALMSAFLVNAQGPAVPPDHTTPPAPVPGDPFYAPLAATGSQDLQQKFMDYAIATFGPRAVFTPAFSAAIRMANPPNRYPAEWRQGMGAFGRLYGSALANEASQHTGRFLTGAILHEDFRYRPSTSKNAMARSFHAVAYTFVDKSDSGHNRIAFANFAGAASGGFVGRLYLPAGYNDLSHAETRTAITFGGFAARNLMREFAPDLLRFSHRLHAPFPRVPIPEWWIRK